MDPFTQKMLERTRQRREALAKKMAASSSVPAPVTSPPNPATQQSRMKRPSPLTENTSHNIQSEGDTPLKRQCLRVTELDIKPDTPAIPSVASRIKNINTQSSSAGEVLGKQSGCRDRLAALAKDINSWEDDLSHHSLKLKEEIQAKKSPKKMWKPPSPLNSPLTQDELRGSKSPRVEPWKSPVKSSPVPSKSPSRLKTPIKSTENDPVSTPKSPGRRSPLINSSPKPFVKGFTGCSPVKNVKFNPTVDDSPSKSPFKTSPARTILRSHSPAKTSFDKIQEEDEHHLTDSPGPSKPPRTFAYRKAPAPPPGRERFVSPEKSAAPASPSRIHVSSPSTHLVNSDQKKSRRQSFEPTNQPVSARKGMWEQRAKQNPGAKSPCMTSTKTTAITPTKSPRSNNDEITDQPVSARMAAWQRKTDKPTVTPQKSFKEAIADRARLFQDRSASKQSPTAGPDTVTPAGNRPPIGNQTKALQQQILQQFREEKRENEIGEKTKREREADLAVVKNRWKDGIIHTTPQENQIKKKFMDDESSSDEDEYRQPPQKRAVVQKPAINKREQNRQKIRDDFEMKLGAMGFEVCDNATSSTPKSHNRHESENSPLTTSRINPSVASKVRHQSESATRHYSLQNNASDGDDVNRDRRREANEDMEKARKQLENEQQRNSVDNEGGYSVRAGKMKRYSSNGGRANSARRDEDKDIDTTESKHTVINDDVRCQTTVTVDNDERARTITIERQISLKDKQRDDQQTSMMMEVESDFTDEEINHRVKCDANGWALSDTNADDTLSQEDLRMATSPQDGGIWKALETRFEHYRQTPQSSYSSYYTENSDRTSLNDAPQTETDNYDGDDDSVEGDDDIYAEMDDLLEEDEDDDENDGDESVVKPVIKPARKSNSGRLRDLPPAASASKRSDASPMVYSIEMYRSNRYANKNQPAPKITVVRRGEHSTHESYEDLPYIPETKIKHRIQELQDLVKQEQSVIIQTSNALNKCCNKNSTFAGSLEQVECNKILLIACQRRQAYIEEIERLKRAPPAPAVSGCKGSLTLSDLKLPLKKEFVARMCSRSGTFSDNTIHYFLVLVKDGAHVIVTQMVSTHDTGSRGLLEFPNLIKLSDVRSDFKFSIEVYGMSITKEVQEKEKSKKGFTPKKLLGRVKGHKETCYGAGPSEAMSVRTTNFSLVSSINITLKSLHNRTFNLPRVPMNSPLDGYIHMKLRCILETNVEERGFLTMFEDVSGFGAWHRRWCVLGNNQMRYWKYPDDEHKKEPMGTINLKNCITDKVGLIPRDICARPNTFELTCIRPHSTGDKNTLVTWSYDTTTATKHMLSADTKEDRLVWCEKLNKALENIRTWQTDAVRPIKPAKRVL